MSLKIGRVGIDTAASDPEVWSEHGDVTSVSGNLFAGSLANARVLRQQILGYMNNEFEKTVPVVWSSDTTRTGFYRVTDAKGDTGVNMLAGYVPFAMTLERVQGYAAPLMETILQGAARTGKPAGVTAQPWFAVTGSTLRFRLDNSTVTTTRITQGSISMATILMTAYAGTPTGFVRPANWYDGASTISAAGKVVVGRQLEQGHTGDWQLDNGLLKIVPGSGNFLDLYIANSGAWVGPSSFNVGYWNGATAVPDIGVPSSVTVLRNSPEESSLRFATGSSFGLPAPIIVDISLRRGSRFASVTLAAPFGNPGIGFRSPSAMSHVDANLGGNVKTTNDGNGNRPYILYAGSFAENLTAGGAYIYGFPAPSIFAAAVGIELGGTSAVTSEHATDARDMWHAAQVELTNIVAA